MSPVFMLVIAMVAATPPAIPGVLEGTDTLPDQDAVAAVDVDTLVAVLVDGRISPVIRARAARLAGQREVDAAVDAALEAVLIDDTAAPALRAQVLLARAEGACRVGRCDVATGLADRAMAERAIAPPELAVAGVLVWWHVGGAAARTRLEGLQSHPVAAVAGAARGRLRHWSRAGQWSAPRSSPRSTPRSTPGAPAAVGGVDVLDPPHGGPSPAR